MSWTWVTSPLTLLTTCFCQSSSMCVFKSVCLCTTEKNWEKRENKRKLEYAHACRICKRLLCCHVPIDANFHRNWICMYVCMCLCVCVCVFIWSIFMTLAGLKPSISLLSLTAWPPVTSCSPGSDWTVGAFSRLLSWKTSVEWI